MLNILKLVPDRLTLFNTVIISANDTLVDMFIKGLIQMQFLQKKKVTRYLK